VCVCVCKKFALFESAEEEAAEAEVQIQHLMFVFDRERETWLRNETSSVCRIMCVRMAQKRDVECL